MCTYGLETMPSTKKTLKTWDNSTGDFYNQFTGNDRNFDDIWKAIQSFMDALTTYKAQKENANNIRYFRDKYEKIWNVIAMCKYKYHFWNTHLFWNKFEFLTFSARLVVFVWKNTTLNQLILLEWNLKKNISYYHMRFKQYCNACELKK